MPEGEEVTIPVVQEPVPVTIPAAEQETRAVLNSLKDTVERLIEPVNKLAFTVDSLHASVQTHNASHAQAEPASQELETPAEPEVEVKEEVPKYREHRPLFGPKRRRAIR